MIWLSLGNKGILKRCPCCWETFLSKVNREFSFSRHVNDSLILGAFRGLTIIESQSVIDAINNIFDEYHQQIFLLPDISTPFGQNVLKVIEKVFYNGSDQLLPENKMGLVQVSFNY